MASSVMVRIPSYGYTYSFSGVLSVRHEFSLKIQTDSESASGTDYVNGARNQPVRRGIRRGPPGRLVGPDAAGDGVCEKEPGPVPGHHLRAYLFGYAAVGVFSHRG